MTELAVKDPAVLEMFKQNASLGTEEMGEAGEFPILKLTTSMSRDNILANGESAKVGMFYHKLTKKEYKEIQGHVLYIKKTDLPDFNNKDIKKMTYVVGGLMDDDGEQLPFIMFVKGFSLQNMWAFQKDLSTIVSSKTMPVPMFALNVTIKVEKRPHEKFKTVDTVTFIINRDKQGHLELETNADTLNMYLRSVVKTKDLIDLLVAQSAGQDDNTPVEDMLNRPEPRKPMKTGNVEDIDSEDISDQIPF